MFWREKGDDSVPGHRVGARVEWAERGSEFHGGSVVEIARAYAVKVHWDDHHPDDDEGWHVLGRDVRYVPGT